MKKVLIVDDEQEVVEFLGNFLGRKQVKVFIATNAKDALNIFRKNTPDLVLLDIGMPEVDGIQLLKIIKKEKRNTRVIMVTGKNDKASINKANKLGANDYITKPLELANLYSVVSKYIA